MEDYIDILNESSKKEVSQDAHFILRQIFFYNILSCLIFCCLYLALDHYSPAWIYALTLACLYISGYLLINMMSIKLIATYFTVIFFSSQIYFSEFVLPHNTIHFLFCLLAPSALLLLFNTMSRTVQLFLILFSLLVICFQLLSTGYMVQIHLNSNGIKLIQIAELMIFFISSMRLFELYQSNFQQLQGKLLEQAYRDELSNLLNRHSLIEIGSNIIRKSVILQQKTSVLFLDIDNFKAINDKLGHATGDKTIEWVSNVIEAHIADTGIAGRYGGEEFVLIYPNTNEQQALARAEALRKHIHRNPLMLDRSSIDNIGNSSQKNIIDITISIGIATQKSSIESLEKLIDRADQALYQAKKSGKNRCEIFQPTSTESSQYHLKAW